MANVDTVIVFTTSMNDLARFYGAGLGLDEPEAHGTRHLGFALDNGVYLGFDEVDVGPTGGLGVSMWFDVDDLQETFDRFVEAGAEVRYSPERKPMGQVLASLVDPDGNVFGLVSREPVSPHTG